MAMLCQLFQAFEYCLVVESKSNYHDWPVQSQSIINSVVQ